jgi:hypothetical protein
VGDPAKDEIALAIERGVEGELGKEGKKGSANDGSKVNGVWLSSFAINLM